jgi:hypothetical protein
VVHHSHSKLTLALKQIYPQRRVKAKLDAGERITLRPFLAETPAPVPNALVDGAR